MITVSRGGAMTSDLAKKLLVKPGNRVLLLHAPDEARYRELLAPLPEGATVTARFDIWSDEARRRRWLPEPITVRKATRPKSMRITWADGRTNVDANFYPKGEGKSYVSAQHGKLPDADAVARMKTFWSAALERMKASLEAVEDAEK